MSPDAALPLPDPASGWTRRLSLGTPGGPTVAVKECLGVAGLVTRAGSPATASRPPETAHSAAVAALVAAGCHVTGLANMHELAYGMTGANALTGTPVNPHWPDRIPGGSSSGSAVLVAAGAVDFAVGTDTGGSIRQPACCCGVYGIKPTFGRISRRGAVPAASSLDSIGVFARDAAMLARGLRALDPTLEDMTIDRPRLAFVPVAMDADIAETLTAALTRLGVTDTRDLPGLDAAYPAAMTVIGHEMAAELGALAASDAPMGDDVRQRLLANRAITDADRAAAETIRDSFTAQVDAALAGLDALILPTLPTVPPTWDQARDPAAMLPLTRTLRQFNLTGHPALTVPLRTAAGLPAGLQLLGAHGEDARLLALAAHLESRLKEEIA